MKKLFFITCFTILFVCNIFGQAAVDLSLIATDGTSTINVNIGLDLTATNCIDPHLGEGGLPPIPPVQMFYCCFDLQPYGCGPVSSLKDYRPPGNPPEFPYTGIVEHTFGFKLMNLDHQSILRITSPQV
ncbi:MAG: hypothetical protein MZV64_01895 [Ignavibacteriales bacterium]|nr:hypothetical protein [Ignavibacteriales bacterium]